MKRLAWSSLLLAGCVFSAATASAQKPQKPERIVKETLEGGGLVLDESGLTKGFEAMNAALRYTAKKQIAGGEVEVHTGRLPVVTRDYKSFAQLESGIVRFELAAAIKLRTATDLKFGDVAVRTGNVAADYPGLYSLWLRKVSEDDWRLVFNRESDAWGSMHDPAADLGEVKLQHARDDSAKSMLMVKLEGDDSRGELQLAWGPHTWTAPFTVEP